MLKRLLRRLVTGHIAGLVGVAAVTALCAPFHERLDHTTVALAYLLAVLLVATGWGSWPALTASLLGVLAFNFFFLPPVHTLTIADPQNAVALGAFFVTAVTAGQLWAFAKRRAVEAETARTAARLATATNRSLLEADPDALVMIGDDGRINDANSAIEALTGRTRSVLIGTDFAEYFTEPEQARAAYREVLRDGFVRDEPLELGHVDGHVTSILYNGSIYRGPLGQVIGVVAAVRPVSSSSARPSVVTADLDIARHLSRFVAAASLLSIAVGLAGLVGWTFDVRALTSIAPGHIIIKPNAAIALVLCGWSLWLLRKGHAEAARTTAVRAGQMLAAAATMIGVASLAEHLLGWDLHIDQLFFADHDPWEAFGRIRPGLMAPITALDFLLLGSALLCLDTSIVFRSRRYRPAQFLAFAANTGAIVGLLDFVLGSPSPSTHVALQTAMTLFLLSFAVACARTASGVGALFVSAGSGGVVTRRLWPATVIVPLLVGTASWRGYSAGLFSEWSGWSVMIVAMIVALAGLAVWSGQSIDRSDQERLEAEGALHRSEVELREAQRLAHMGSWWWDPRTDAVTWSEGLYRIVGRDPKLAPPSFAANASFYTPDSFSRLAAAVERAVRVGASFGLDLDMIRPDGEVRSVSTYGEAAHDASGAVTLVRGTVHDVTEHKQAEEALRRSEANLNKAQEIAHIGSWVLDVARNRLSWSDEVFRIFGISRETPLTYESFLAMVHPADRQAVETAWADAMRGADYDIEHRIFVADTVKWVRERARVEFDEQRRPVKGVGTVQDITERKRAQQELVRLNRALRALSLCNQALMRTIDESAWLEQVCRIIVDEAGYRFCWVGRAEHDDAKTVTPVALAGVDDGFLSAVRVTWGEGDQDLGPTATSIRATQQQIVTNIAAERTNAPWRDEALKRGYASAIAIPLIVDSELFGALTIYSADTGAFREEEVKLLTELAGDLGFGVTTLRTRADQKRAEEALRELNVDLEARVVARTADLEAAREREAAVGFRIQQMLLLTQPPTDVPGVRVAALTIPSQRVDGDFYDFFRPEHACLDVIVADVMGKGIPAALLAAATKSNVLEALCHLMALNGNGGVPQPKDIVALAHADMVRQLIDLESFVTLSYARFDLNRRHLDLVDCGHTGMMMVHGRTGACEILHGENLPLGIREGEVFDQLDVTFEPGDLFLFYSDGITDVRNRAGELFGADRLSDFIRANRELEPQALVEAVRKTAVAFGESERFSDDLTCVVVKVAEAPRRLAHAELEIRSSLPELQRARAFVRDCCAAAEGRPFSQGEVADLELAVNEAACNIMKHAYHGRGDQPIQLEIDTFADRVSVRLLHLGDSFDPSTVSPPALDGSRESGFGIYLIGKSVDELRYARDDRGRNCIELVKLRKS